MDGRGLGGFAHPSAPSYSRDMWGEPKSYESTRAVPLADRLAGELDRHHQA
jgi:hypothetical protein